MFETFTQTGADAVQAAKLRAGFGEVDVAHLFAGLCMPYLTSAHLLHCLALLDEQQEIAGNNTQENLQLDRARRTSTMVVRAEPPFSESLTDVLRIADQAAVALGEQISSHHLLFGIVRHGDNDVARLLDQRGLGTENIWRFTTFAATMEELRGNCVSAGEACFSGDLSGTTSTSVREPELRRLLQVLSRRTRNNAVLIGDPGVGKTVVLDDLMRRFANWRLPHTLQAKEVFRVQWDALHAAGTVAAVLSDHVEEAARPRNVILVLDDVAKHVDFMGHLGSGGIVAALWHQLSKADIQVIVTMTPVEYARFTTESPLHRFFEPVRIPELSTEQTATAINAVVRQEFQAHHAVTISDAAVHAAAELADRYIPDQFLPSKAITLLDETCANIQPSIAIVDRYQTEVDDAAVRRTLAELKGIPVRELEPAQAPTPRPPTLAAPATTRLPHRPSSTALLLGTAHYDHSGLPDTPAITNNLRILHRRLTDSRNGSFDPDRVHQPSTDLDRAHLPALVQATRSAMDTLLVYYSGHGFIADDGQLHLGLSTTDPELWEYTALPYDQLRKAVRDAPARNKILILDCCFAGRAIDDLSGSDSSGQLDIEGTYVLTATTATRTAHASDGADHTAFTGALLHVLGEGIDETEELIRLSAIYSRLDRLLIAKALPKPQQRGTNNIHNLALTRNPRWDSSLSP